jgi:tetratricopeptide (TPR) repeat protein
VTVAAPRIRLTPWQGALLLFALAWAVRLAALGELSGTLLFEHPVVDGRRFDLWAQSLAGLRPAEEGAYFQAPGYPVFVAAIYSVWGRDLLAVRVVQATLGALACVFLALSGRRLGGRRAGWLAGLLLALYPQAVFHDLILQKTSLAVCFLCLTLFLATEVAAVRREQSALWRCLALGLAMGGLAQLRENAAILAPLLVAWVVWGRPGRLAQSARARAQRVAAFGLALLLAFAPATWANYRASGQLLPTTYNLGLNLWIGNNPDADGLFRAVETGWVGPGQEQAVTVGVAERSLGRDLSPREISRFWLRRTWEGVARDPGRWAWLMLEKIRLALNDAEPTDSDSPQAYAEESRVLGGLLRVLRWGLVFPLAAVGLVAGWREGRWRREWLLPGAFAALVFSLVVFFVLSRYRMMLVPPVLLLAGLGLGRLRRPASGSARAGQLALLTGCALFSFTPTAPRASGLAVHYTNLGVVLAQDGELEPAEQAFRRALAAEPTLGPAHANMGRLAFLQGHYAAARQHDLRALELIPAEAGGLARREIGLRVAQATLALGELEEAEDLLRARVHEAEDDGMAWRWLGEAQRRQGKLSAARESWSRALSLDPQDEALARALAELR